MFLRWVRKIQTNFFKVVSLWVISALLFPMFVPPAEALFGWGSDDRKATGPKVERMRVVSIWIEESLLENEDLEDKIKRYALDIQKDLKAQTVLIPVPSSFSPYDIHETNARLYFSGIENDQRSQLVGTILIGEVPLPVIEKEENLWPTVFPYVDFIEPIYIWDAVKERFVYEGSSSHEPEIWHGAIRSDYHHEGKTKDRITEIREEELSDYFDRNHEYRSGTLTFGKRVFLAGLPTQKEGLQEALRRHYGNFITYVEEILYNRYNKHLFQQIAEDESAEDEPLILAKENDPAYLHIEPSDFFENFTASEVERQTGQVDLTPEEFAALNLSPINGGADLGDDDYTGLPDIHTKGMVQKFTKRYIQAFAGALSNWTSRVQMAGRWEPTEIDTTISWVTRKDEAAAYLLRANNDLIEEILIRDIDKGNVPAEISVPRRTFFHNGSFRNRNRALYPPVEASYTPYWTSYPLYWNGVKREGADFEITDCTLNRGTAADANHPFSVLIEANRTYNFDTVDTCDIAANCCARYIDFDDDGVPSPTSCITTSHWPSQSNHVGSKTQVFDLKGTKEVETGLRGGHGCASIIAENIYREITSDKTIQTDSLMIHVEPTDETIQEQVEGFNVRSLPIDDPRSFSFYDHGDVFQKIRFPNVFDLRPLFTEQSESDRHDRLKEQWEADLEAKKLAINEIIDAANAVSDSRFATDQGVQWPGPAVISESGYRSQCRYSKTVNANLPNRTIDWVRTCDFNENNNGGYGGGRSDHFQEIDRMKRVYGVGTPLEEAVFTQILDRLERDKIIDAVIWLDKDLAEKNRLVFDAAMDTPADQREFLYDQAFNGYELAQIEGDRLDGNTLDLAFERGEALGSEVYEWTKQEALAFDLNPPEVLAPEAPIRPVETIQLSSSLIQLAAGAVTPQKIEVSFLDEHQKVIESLRGRVSLNLEDPDRAHEFFRLSGGNTANVREGKASFWIVPKARGEAEKFPFEVQFKDVKTQGVIAMEPFSLELLADRSHLEAGSSDGSLVEFSIRDTLGQVTTAFDGQTLRVQAEEGSFPLGDDLLVENGAGSFIYQPGRSAGDVVITVQDEAQKLPAEPVTFTVEPSDPEILVFETEHEHMLSQAGWMEVEAKVLDVYENLLDEHPRQWKWTIEGGTLRSLSGVEGPIIEEKTEKAARSRMWVKPDRTAERLRVQVWVDELGDARGRAMDIALEERGVIQLEIENKGPFLAGETESMDISLQAQTQEGESLLNNFALGVLSSTDEDFEPVILTQGQGDFSLPLPTKVGDYSVMFTAPGFESVSQDFSIEPGSAAKIVLNSGEDSLPVKSTDPFVVQVSVVDRHDNVVPTFNETIQVRLNDTKISGNFEKDDLIEQGIVSEDDPRAAYLETLEEAAHTSDKTLLDYASTTVQVTQGQTTIEYESLGRAGRAHLTARGGGLVPGYFYFDVGKSFGEKDLESIVPRTLFLLLLGFPGGDPVFESNLANRFLFQSSTQAIATLISSPRPRKRFGIVGESGSFRGESVMHLQFSAFPEIQMTYQDRALSRLRLVFDETKDTSFQRVLDRDQSAPGAYFQPEKSLENRLSLQDRSIFVDQEHLWTVSDKGGVQAYFGALKFEPEEGRFLSWNVYLHETKLGTFFWVLEDGDQKSFAEREDLDEPAIGEIQNAKILIKILDAEMRVEEVITGKTTQGERGRAIVSLQEEEPFSRVLGAQTPSIEEATSTKEVWEGTWKPATLFAAGNTVGDSVKWGGSDVLLVIGDPTIKLSEANPTATSGLSEDIGQPLWKIANETIDQILLTDINGDGQKDILPLTRDRLWALNQTKVVDDGLNVQDLGVLLRFPDGVQKLIAYEDKDEILQSLLQINHQGQILSHSVEGGVFAPPETLDLGMAGPATDLQKANLDGDDFEDLVATDENNRIYKIHADGNGGFTTAPPLDQQLPKFTEIRESYSPSLTEQAETPTLDQFLVTMPDIELYVQEDSRVAFREDGKVYYSLTDTTVFDAELVIKNKVGENTVDVGDELDISFKIISEEDFEVDIIVPHLQGQQLNKESFFPSNLQSFLQPFKASFLIKGEVHTESVIPVAQGLTSQPEDHPQGAFLLAGVSLETGKHWNLLGNSTVTDIPDLVIQVEDMDNDGVLDISFLDGGDVVSYRSQTVQGGAGVGSGSSVDGGPGLTLVGAESDLGLTPSGEHSRRVFSVTPPTTETPVATAASQEASVEAEAEDSDEDGLPDYYDDRPEDADNAFDFTFNASAQLASTIDSMADSFLNIRNSQVCGGASCGGVATISEADAGVTPGLNISYSPPYGVMSGVSPGFPVFAVPTSKKPYVWPPSSPGWNSVSNFRIYKMGTSTGASAVALCDGKYPVGMAFPTFKKNCTLVTKPILNLSSCQAAESPGETDFLVTQAQSLSAGNHGSVFSVGAESERTDSSQFTINAAFPDASIDKYKFNLTNNTLKGVDDVMRWLQKSFEELSNIKVPSVTMILPRFPQEGDDSDWTKETEGEEDQEPPEDVASMLTPPPRAPFEPGQEPIQDLYHFPEERDLTVDHMIKNLENLPFVILRKETIALPYPAISEKRFEALEVQYQQSWEPQMTALITRIKSEQSQYPDNAHDVSFYIARLEEVYQRTKVNLQTIRGYRTAVENIKKIPRTLEDRLQQIEANIAMMRSHFSEFFSYIDQSIEDWQAYYKRLQATYRQWETIVDVFQRFSVQFPKCTVDRGKIPDFVIRNVFLNGVTYPEIKSPKLPSYLFDFSRTEMSVDLDIPDLSFEPIEIELPGLSDIDFSYSLAHSTNMPWVPKIPLLPVLKAVPFDPPIEDISLPSLEQEKLIDRPVPDDAIFSDLTNLLNTGMVHINNKYFKLLGMLQINATRIPEWYIKPHLEQLTNRTNLIPQDFTKPVLYEVAPREEVPDVEIPINLDGFIHSVRGMTKEIRTIAHQFNCTISEVPISLRDPRYKGPPCNLYEEPIQPEERPPSKPPTSAPLLFRGERTWAEHIANSSREERLQQEYMISKILSGERGGVDKSSLAALLFSKGLALSGKSHPGWTAANGDVIDDTDTSTQEGQALEGLYFINPDTRTTERVNRLPADRSVTFAFGDIDNDGVEEIVYALDNEIYVKERNIPSPNNPREEEDDEEEELDNDLFSNLIEWETYQATEHESPLLDPTTKIRASGAGLSFEPRNQTPYFEWVVSDRSDHRFEIIEAMKDRFSTYWHRWGFFVRDKGLPGQVRPAGIRVTSIEGQPVFFASPFQELPLQSTSACQNEASEKIEVRDPTAFVGMKNTSEMLWTRPPLPGMEEARIENIRLQQGEEVWIDEGELCLEKGRIQSVREGSRVSQQLQLHQFLPTESRIETGPNNGVELQLFDGTRLIIQQGESYQLEHFGSDSLRLRTFQNFPKGGNFYGSLWGWKENERSFSWGGFLHDPAPQDDQESPVLSIKGGERQYVALLSEVIVDATASKDNQRITEVWWDLDGTTDRDGDGDPLNDRDFPEEGSTEERTPRDLLTLQLPAFTDRETKIIVLHAKDQMGHHTQKSITFEVQVPEMILREASFEGQRIAGKVPGAGGGVPVTMLRKRGLQWEEVLVAPLLTDPGGRFEIQELSTEGGIELRDRKTKEVLLEILPNGRPVRYDESFGFMVEPANEDHGFRIRVHDERNNDILYVRFITDPKIGFVVSDLDESDAFVWKSFESEEVRFQGALALIDEEAPETVSLLDRQGNIFVTDTFSLGLKASSGLEAPLIFQIRKNKIPIAEVLFPVASEVWLERSLIESSETD